MALIILDRDGVINEDSEHFVKTLEEWIPIPGSLEAMARLSQAGHRLVIATNQSGLARGLLTLDDLNAMHQRLRESLAGLGGQLEGIFFCPHGPADDCQCRKPRPGLLLQIRDRLQVDIGSALVIGDSLRDLEAAWALGASAMLVLTGKGAQTLERHADRLGETPVYPNLAAAADAILAR
jgi:D-glycero-D-manno-heptose 1,7-bisphosphate phosphatase